jgi:ABC-type multidrug transport system fused ATPase/permease subunit
LLLKEREDYEGEITYDTLSLRDISRTSYFKHVAVVLQDTEVFNFSLRDNITIANTKSSDKKVNLKRALDVAHVSEFVNKLSSGSQILFLDEATSHLDLESEDKIRDSLAQFFKDVTAVVIAHRLTTIREMDRILVLEDGRIVEEGTWNSLMRKRGRFRELWDKQRL